jgi:hypothetical protein
MEWIIVIHPLTPRQVAGNARAVAFNELKDHEIDFAADGLFTYTIKWGL